MVIRTEHEHYVSQLPRLLPADARRSQPKNDRILAKYRRNSSSARVNFYDCQSNFNMLPKFTMA